MTLIGPWAGPPKEPQTWVQISPTVMHVGAGPDMVVLYLGDEWRMTRDRRLWKRVR